MENITTINPANSEKLQDYPIHTRAQVQEIMAASAKAFSLWKSSAMESRLKVLQKLSEELLSEKTKLAELMHSEMGKTMAEGIAEVEKCATAAKYYAENAPALLAPQPVATEAKKSFVSFEPLGTVLAIMPWNFPFWQAVRCAAPAITAGNAVILKHASNVTGCALALEKIFERVAPKDLFRAVIVPGKEALSLIAMKEIKAVSLTGSTDVGRQVAAIAGHELKKCVLELGGSDAYVVLADADLQAAAKICAQSRLINAGQSCIAAKRFIVESPVLKQFTDLFVKEIQSISIAPMARVDLRDQLHEQVQKAVKQGAKVLCGGEVPQGKGAHYPATVLAGVKPGNAAFEEELFGPVAAIIEASGEREAIDLANATSFGLGAAVFTSNPAKAEHIAQKELEAGSCFANAFVKSDARLPFGGIKSSGFGRELSGFGIREFTNVKTVYIN